MLLEPGAFVFEAARAAFTPEDTIVASVAAIVVVADETVPAVEVVVVVVVVDADSVILLPSFIVLNVGYFLPDVSVRSYWLVK